MWIRYICVDRQYPKILITDKRAVNRCLIQIRRFYTSLYFFHSCMHFLQFNDKLAQFISLQSLVRITNWTTQTKNNFTAMSIY
jgi:hypothetical protein